MLQYHVGFYMPRGEDRMVVAEVLDFPGVVSQGFDLADARAMIASALEDMAESYLEEGRPLPPPSATATDPEADFVELIPLSVAAGVMRPGPARLDFFSVLGTLSLRCHPEWRWGPRRAAFSA